MTSEPPRAAVEGELLWEPDAKRVEGSRLRHFMAWLARERGLTFEGYIELWRWSVDDVSAFWLALVDYFGVTLGGERSPVLRGAMPEAHWFPHATINYAEQLLRRRDQHTALVALDETGARQRLTYAELAEQVARARAGLLKAGVQSGDRVAPSCRTASRR